MQKNKDQRVIKHLHERAVFTAKTLTAQTVEGHQPITFTLSKHGTVNKENVKLLLYRIQKLY